MAEVVSSRPRVRPLLGPLRKLGEASASNGRSPEELEQESWALAESLLDRWESSRNASTSAASALPAFFKPKPKPSSIASLIRKEARARRDQIKSESILDEAALHDIWTLMEEFSKSEDDVLKINYDGFSQVATRAREMFGPVVDSCFRASLFARFSQDDEGYISASAFAAYLGMRSNMQTMRLQLGAFDEADNGLLTEFQLEEFLRAQAAELPALEDMEPHFLPQYTRIAARKVLFFHGKSGSVRVRDLITSPLIKELVDLRDPDLADPSHAGSLMSNWFSLQSTRRVHNTFLALDEDMNGMLSRSEFAQISNGTMSPLFIQRIFEEHVMQRRSFMHSHRGSSYRDEMDLISFTDFVLAWDHRSTPAAIKYFFPIMDLQKKGSISPAELYTFFREIHVMWVKMGEYADLAIYDVVDEILDMIKPKNPPCITAEDLEASGMSGIFFSILSDVKQFYDYNYRENFMHQDDNES